MKKENIEFLIKFSQKIMEIREIFRREDWSCLVNESTNWKDYYTIDFKFESCNAKYEDSIVFYSDDDFNEDRFWDDFDVIIEKAKKITQ